MFEHVIDALFRAHGYRTQTNAVLVGQSGARHEIDVLASRREDLLETRVGVECKNWAQPIDTAVVARARLVRDDLGLGPDGDRVPGRSDARRTHDRRAGGRHALGAPELAARLGPAALAALGPAPGGRAAARRRPHAVTGARASGRCGPRPAGRSGWAAGRSAGWATRGSRCSRSASAAGARAGLRQRLRVRAAYTVYESLTGQRLLDRYDADRGRPRHPRRRADPARQRRRRRAARRAGQDARAHRPAGAADRRRAPRGRLPRADDPRRRIRERRRRRHVGLADLPGDRRRPARQPRGRRRRRARPRGSRPRRALHGPAGRAGRSSGCPGDRRARPAR